MATDVFGLGRLSTVLLGLRGLLEAPVPAVAAVAIRPAADAIPDTPGPVAALADRARHLPMPELLEAIGRLADAHIRPVSEDVASLERRFGTRSYAALMGPWMAGERLVVRAWAEAADDHRPEAVSCLEEATQRFELTAAILARLLAADEGG